MSCGHDVGCQGRGDRVRQRPSAGSPSFSPGAGAVGDQAGRRDGPPARSQPGTPSPGRVQGTRPDEEPGPVGRGRDPSGMESSLRGPRFPVTRNRRISSATATRPCARTREVRDPRPHPEGGSLLRLPASGGARRSWAGGHALPVSASVFTWLLLCLCLSSYKDSCRRTQVASSPNLSLITYVSLFTNKVTF